MKLKYNNEIMKLMHFFEQSTKAELKDCFIDNNGTIVFVVGKNIGSAIGKNGATARKLEASLKRRIKIVDFSDNMEWFVSNLLAPLKIKDIQLENRIVTITPFPESRGYIIGRAGSNLRSLEAAVKRFFTIDKIKVI